MSITIDFFFNYGGNIESLLKDLENWVGCYFLPYENNPDDLYCRFLGMELSFSEHELENDRDLDFENFKYEIGIRTPIPDADFRTQQLLTMASLTYAMYRRLQISGILVFDLQSLLARYEIHGEKLFDTISKKVVEYPEHLSNLFKVIPKDALNASWESPTIEYLENLGRQVENS